MRVFRGTISILLSFIIILSVFTIVPFTVNAEQTTDSSPAYVAYQAKRYSDPYGQNLFGDASQTYAQTYYNQMKKDKKVVSGIAIWEAAHIATSPTYSLESGLITKKDMYKLAIFDMLDLSESDTFVSNLLNVANDSRLSYIVSVSKSICDPNDIKVSELKNFEVNAEYINFLKESAKLAKAFDVIDKISTIASGCKNLYEAILTTANYQAISDMKNGVKEVLSAVYADTSNPSELRQAAYECVNNFGDGFDRILNTVSTGSNLCLNATLDTIFEEAVNSIWGEIISLIPGGKVVATAAKGMRVLSNAVFAMDDTCRIYYQFEADVTLEQAIRNVMNNAKCDYIQDKNQDKAIAYMRAVEMYKRIVLQGYDYTKEMLEIKANAPATKWFDWFNHNYSECMELIEGVEDAKSNNQKLYKQFEEWVQNDYINLYCKDYNETINSFNNQKAIKTTSVTLTQIKDINVGDSGYIYDYIKKTCLPENSTEYKKCYFTADNKNIFTIDKLGSFVAESAGQVTLVYDKGGELETSITITVGEVSGNTTPHNYYSDFQYDIINYNEKTAEIYGYTGKSSNLIIPSSIDGYTVKYIQQSTFKNCETIVHVTIPDTVSGGIGYDAFEGCTNLRTIKIGNKVTSIGESAFENCTNLSNVIIGNNVQWIYSSAFKNCTSLNSIIIPDSVKLYNESYSREIFSGCIGLKSVVVGNNVSMIGPEMFYNCKNLENITIGKNVKKFCYEAFKGCDNLKKCNFLGTIDDWCGIEYSGTGEDWPTYYSKNLYINGDLVHDIEIKERSIINSFVFLNCENIERVLIHEGVTDIGQSAFEGCINLSKIKIPESIISIGYETFKDCKSLSNIDIPKGLKKLGNSVFSGCTSLASIEIPYGISKLSGTFYNCENLKEVKIPDSVTELFATFAGCTNLLIIDIPNSVTDIGSSTFKNCSSLESIILPESVESLGFDLFYNCTNLKSVVLPESVKSTCLSGWFYNCVKLESVIIPKNITVITAYSFQGCSNLKRVTIPDSVTEIGGAFNGCSNLNGVYISDIEAWCNIKRPDGWFSSNPLYYAHNLYLNDQLVVNLDLPESVSKIEDKSFLGCTCITSVRIPNSTTIIGEYAFYECSSLTSIKIPDGVTSIGDWAFEYCSSLTSINIPDSVTSIGDWAFEYCSSLTSIKIPDGVTSIGYETFYGCTSLTSVTIPDSVTSIGDYAFHYCDNLKDVYYLGSKEQWNNIYIDKYNDDLLDANIHFARVDPTTVTTEPTTSTTESTTVTTEPTTSTTEPTTVTTVPTTVTTESNTDTTQPTTQPTTVTTQPTTTKPVVKKVTKVTLNQKAVTLINGKSMVVKATVTPSNATNKKLKWTTSNSKVATVNASGKITAKGKGVAIIKVMALDGSNKYATLKVTVKQPVTSVKLNRNTATLKLKGKSNQKSVTLKANVLPKNANNKAVTWKSSNTKVAIVNSKGKVTAKKKGTCYITATAKDGSKKSAKCKITVR